MTDALSELEQGFPHIVRHVVDAWGKPACLTYIDSLMVDSRGGRKGFPFGALTEIMLLREVHVAKHGDPHAGPANIWYS